MRKEKIDLTKKNRLNNEVHFKNRTKTYISLSFLHNWLFATYSITKLAVFIYNNGYY